MPNYIVLMNYTEKGLQNIAQWRDRLNRAKMCLRDSGGGGSVQVFLTMGPYDAVAVVQANSDEQMAAFLLHLGAYGNVHTKTLKAFPEDQFDKIIDLMKRLPKST